MDSIAEGVARSFYLDDNHALYRKTAYGNQLVIPKSQQANLLALQHHSTVAAHPGMNKMYYTMRTKSYWPSMISDIHGTITNCTACAQNRLSLILGPLLPSKSGNCFIFVMTDRFAKLTKCVALKKTTAIAVASAVIEHWVSCMDLRIRSYLIKGHSSCRTSSSP